MCLGLIIGIAEATSSTRLVVITGLVGGFANAFGNSIGFFMSQSAERALQIQTADHGSVTRIHSKREVLANSLLSFASTIFAVFVLLLPFPFLPMSHATILTFAIGVMTAFVLGSYVGKVGHESVLKGGLKYALLAVLGAAVSHLIADLVLTLT